MKKIDKSKVTKSKVVELFHSYINWKMVDDRLDLIPNGANGYSNGGLLSYNEKVELYKRPDLSQYTTGAIHKMYELVVELDPWYWTSSKGVLVYHKSCYDLMLSEIKVLVD